MARFLSPEWFDELEAAVGSGEPGSPLPTEGLSEEGPGAQPGLVVEVVVTNTPEGEVRYQVVVEGTRVLVRSPRAAPRTAQVRLSGDYATMAGIASGELSALDALSHGRTRVSGDISTLSVHPSRLGGLDLLPPVLRASTTF